MYLWTGLLIQLVTMFRGVLAQERKTDGKNRIHDGWMWFSLSAEEYLRLYGQLPQAVLILQAFQWQYLYALFAAHRMGLGP